MTTKVSPKMISGPVFNAYLNVAQSPVTANQWVKVLLDTELFDPSGSFASSRFQPTIAGYYQLNGIVSCAATSSVSAAGVQIYKNGAGAGASVASSTGANCIVQVSTLIYLNGSTDYAELYGYINGVGTLSFGNGSNATQLSGFLVGT